MRNTVIAALVVIFVTTVVAFLHRWEFSGLSSGQGISNYFLIDHWTGTVRVINSGNWRIVEETKPLPNMVDLDKLKQ